jgi:hypothetical protein
MRYHNGFAARLTDLGEFQPSQPLRRGYREATEAEAVRTFNLSTAKQRRTVLQESV